ncbi:hypothetical protein QBZ16_003326 [Prototheca wickerhamii]|uniref:Uncharacterized protein n=1 Tax=Prototheca wickerhamii TaxID=3111 RepID=A0AAD9IHB9_PROWI|nr:hypothetical protein QBZ16_003326 [Prototheca wickerhamii]
MVLFAKRNHEPPSDDSDWCSSGDELYGCAKCRYAWKGCANCRERRPAFVRPRGLRWRPAAGRPQSAPPVKTFYPTPEEFADPMAYISSITPEACRYGAAHIVPPPGEFDPPFALERGTTGASMESFRFSIRRQPTAKLSRRSPDRLAGAPGTGKHALRGRCAGGTCLMGAGDGERERDSDASSSGSEFGFPIASRTHTLRSFAAYADWARSLHFRGAPLVPGARQAAAQRRPPGAGAPRDPLPAPTLEQVEAEFWRVVEAPRPEDEALGSLYGQDLDSGLHGSGFPLPRWRRELLARALRERGQRGAAEAVLGDEPEPGEGAALADRWAEHPWNVNNMPRAASSVLALASSPDGEPITGVMVPWLYVGSALSAFSWHVEDHALYSVNFHHMGAEKVWYCVPPTATRALEDAMRDALPDLYAANPALVYGLVTMLSPAELQRRGVPVFRLVQRPGEFVVTMPNSYHSGFNAGFNCAEAVNFAPAPWLPFGTDILDKYRRSRKPSTFSHDSLLVALVRKGIDGAGEREAGGAAGEIRAPPRRPGRGALGSPAQPGAGSAPPAAIQPGTVCLAAGDLALRAAEERRRLLVGAAAPGAWAETLAVPRVDQATGEAPAPAGPKARKHKSPREKARTQASRTGPPLDTADADCIVCACDLWLSAAWSPALPDVLACPEHAPELARRAAEAAPDAGPRLVLLQRHVPEQLEALVARAASLYPGVTEAVRVASGRAARNEAERVKCVPCGPLYAPPPPPGSPRASLEPIGEQEEHAKAAIAATADIAATAGTAMTCDTGVLTEA